MERSEIWERDSRIPLPPSRSTLRRTQTPP
jgi:hypothetical protein